MNDPDATGQKFPVLEGLVGLEIHLRCIGFRDLHLASKIDLTGRRFTSMVAIGHDNVIELTLTAYGSDGLRRHGRRINQNLVFAYVQKQPVEVEMILLSKTRPLIDDGHEQLHAARRW